MRVVTGRMTTNGRRLHHRGWLRVFRCRRMVEVWVGDRWLVLDGNR